MKYKIGDKFAYFSDRNYKEFRGFAEIVGYNEEMNQYSINWDNGNYSDCIPENHIDEYIASEGWKHPGPYLVHQDIKKWLAE